MARARRARPAAGGPSPTTLSGEGVLSGDLLELYQRVDAFFVRLARDRFGAGDHLFPPTIAAREIARTNYLQSFPHLATFPVSLEPSAENVAEFAAGETLSPGGELSLTRLSPVTEMLAPAACYHFFVRLQGSRADAARFFTTRGACFRREATLRFLERQSSFSMREIVCVGSVDDANGFLARCRELMTSVFERLRLPIRWEDANDSFYRGAADPRYVFQKLHRVKTEMVYGDGLAIGSLNNHLNYFGETFSISHGGRPAFSACLAVGLERWLAAFASEYGPERRHWPELALD
jgi:hypothetical protein